MSVIGAVVGEFFGGPLYALGIYITLQTGASNYPSAWAAIVLACALGIVLYLAAVALERLVDPVVRGTRDGPMSGDAGGLPSSVREWDGSPAGPAGRSRRMRGGAIDMRLSRKMLATAIAAVHARRGVQLERRRRIGRRPSRRPR